MIARLPLVHDRLARTLLFLFLSLSVSLSKNLLISQNPNGHHKDTRLSRYLPHPSSTHPHPHVELMRTTLGITGC